MSSSAKAGGGPVSSSRRRVSLAAALLVAGGLIALGAILITGRASARPEARFGIHTVWFEGAGDESREDLDRFLRCLVTGSNLNHYWDDAVRLVIRGSWALPAPKARLDWTDLGGWLSAEIDAGRMPMPEAGETPLYLVFGGHPQLWVGACGRNGEAQVAGVRAGLGVIRNRPHCWPTRDRRRSETQITIHELVEAIDRLLGFTGCAGGGGCRGRAICPDPCDTFVGLQCPGAPMGTPTGCEGGVVDGWVVQKFSRTARAGGRCEACTPCDFTPRACHEGEAGCGMAAAP